MEKNSSTMDLVERNVKDLHEAFLISVDLNHHRREQSTENCEVSFDFKYNYLIKLNNVFNIHSLTHSLMELSTS
jgi:hypothetical protein